LLTSRGSRRSNPSDEKIWLPLAAISADDEVVPPPDVSWVWLCHQLAPEHYVEDTAELCGCTPSRRPSALQRGTAAGPAAIARAVSGLPYTDEEYERSAASWRAFCESRGLGPEPFFVPWAAAPPTAAAEAPSADVVFASSLGYDIRAAVARQIVFNYQGPRPAVEVGTSEHPRRCSAQRAVFVPPFEQ
jgi:hypothetical protein